MRQKLLNKCEHIFRYIDAPLGNTYGKAFLNTSIRQINWTFFFVNLFSIFPFILFWYFVHSFGKIDFCIINNEFN